MPPEALLFGLFLVVVIVLAIIGSYMAAQRRKALMAWAQSHSLTFDASHWDLENDYSFSCLRQGDGGRYAYNLMTGQWSGRNIRAFDYHYTTHSTDSKGRRRTHHHHFSAVILDSRVPLKPLLIRPESFFDKIGEFFGLDDIDFESAQFSRCFYVKADDKKWAYDVLHQRAMEFLLAAPRFCIQFDPSCVIAYRSSTFRAEDFQAAAQVIDGLLDRFPEYLVRQQRGEG